MQFRKIILRVIVKIRFKGTRIFKLFFISFIISIISKQIYLGYTCILNIYYAFIKLSMNYFIFKFGFF